MSNHRKTTGHGTYLIRTNHELVDYLRRLRVTLDDRNPANVRVEKAA